MNDQLTDVTYWLIVQISKRTPPVDLKALYQGTIELDYLYQILTSKAQHHWWSAYSQELTPTIVNSAFFRAVSALKDRDLEFKRSRRLESTDWVRELLHR